MLRLIESTKNRRRFRLEARQKRTRSPTPVPRGSVAAPRRISSKPLVVKYGVMDDPAWRCVACGDIIDPLIARPRRNAKLPAR